MNHILLMGNPNVGKSAVFSRLTGVHVIASNYPGTTVEFTEGYMKKGTERVRITDVPGTYTLEPTCEAEQVAVKILAEGADCIINVIDSTNLERNLYLTLELLERNIPVILALNMWDETRHKGIHIDIETLSEMLGVPAIPIVGITGEGIKKLIDTLPQAAAPVNTPADLSNRWERIGRIISRAQSIRHRHHSFLQSLEEMSIRPVSGLVIALLVIAASFTFVRFTGEGLINYVFDPLFTGLYQPLVESISSWLGGQGLVHDIVVGKLINGEIDFQQSFGLITTGLYVPLCMVFPYILAFYLILSFLEDTGYLPRMTVLFDNIFHHLGLHGYGFIPMAMGLGCNVPGIMATRVLESYRERLIASTLLCVGVPCAALQAMIIGLVGNLENGWMYVTIVFGTLFIVSIIIGVIMNQFYPGFSPELLIEVPPYRIPSARVMFKKFWVRMIHFLKEAVPFVLAGVLIVNILYFLHVFEWVSSAAAPVVTGFLGLPKEAVTALLIGFLRKDIAVGMLGTLHLSANQLVVSSVVLSMFFPCIATFIVLLRELGWKGLIQSTLIMIASAVITGTVLNLILTSVLGS